MAVRGRSVYQPSVSHQAHPFPLVTWTDSSNFAIHDLQSTTLDRAPSVNVSEYEGQCRSVGRERQPWSSKKFNTSSWYLHLDSLPGPEPCPEQYESLCKEFGISNAVTATTYEYLYIPWAQRPPCSRLVKWRETWGETRAVLTWRLESKCLPVTEWPIHTVSQSHTVLNYR